MFKNTLRAFFGWLNASLRAQPVYSTTPKPHGGYLVEIRLYGPIKKFAKDAIYTVAKRFRLRGNTRKNPVPHVTLYGPFSTSDDSKVVATIKQVCEKYCFKGSKDDFVTYTIAGFKTFQGGSGKVVCLDIIPSEKLEKLTTDLANELNLFCKGCTWDLGENKLFHSTIAFRDQSLNWKHKQVMEYLGRIRPPNVECPVLRVTLLRPGGKIFCEYDLIQDRLMNRDEALNREVFLKSASVAKEFVYGQNQEPVYVNRIKFSKRRNKGNVRAQKRRWRARLRQSGWFHK